MVNAPLLYEVEASILAPGTSEARMKRSAVVFDTSPEPRDELPGPGELLATAFAACMLKNVERFSRLLGFRQEGARVRVVAERQESPPRFTRVEYELVLATDEPPERVELLRRNLVKFGSVYNTLAAVFEVTGTIRAEAPVGSGVPGE